MRFLRAHASGDAAPRSWAPLTTCSALLGRDLRLTYSVSRGRSRPSTGDEPVAFQRLVPLRRTGAFRAPVGGRAAGETDTSGSTGSARRAASGIIGAREILRPAPPPVIDRGDEPPVTRARNTAWPTTWKRIRRRCCSAVVA